MKIDIVTIANKQAEMKMNIVTMAHKQAHIYGKQCITNEIPELSNGIFIRSSQILKCDVDHRATNWPVLAL